MSNRILSVVNNAGSPAADEAFVVARRVAAGDTNTYFTYSGTLPSASTYDVILVGGSVTTANLAGKLDSQGKPVISMKALPHSKYATADSVSSGSSANLDVLNTSDPLTAGVGATGLQAVTSTAAAAIYILSTGLGSGAAFAVCTDSTHTTRAVSSRYTSGGLLSDGTTAAPARLVHYAPPPGYANLNTLGLLLLDNAWAYLGAGSTLSGSVGSATQAVRATVTLTATPSGGTGPYTYLWSHLSGPSTVGALSSTTSRTPTYTAPDSAATPDVWRCTITDSASASVTPQGTISYSNTAPTANAESDQTVQATGTPASTTFDVQLDGTGSFDPEGSALVFAWSIATTVSGSATLSSTTASQPLLHCSKYGFVGTISLTVTDSGGVSSSVSTVAVTAYPVAFVWAAHNGLRQQCQQFAAHNGLIS